MISSKFPKSFRVARGLVVFMIFRGFSDFTKFTKHHQVTSTPKSLRKLSWNHLTVFLLSFKKNRRSLFVLHGPSPIYWIHLVLRFFRANQGRNFTQSNWADKMVEPEDWNFSTFSPYSNCFCAWRDVHLHWADEERLQSWIRHEYVTIYNLQW